MITSMYIPQVKLLQFQELVKCHDLRFCGNPFTTGKEVYVCISSEHLPPGGANAFFAAWDRATRPIVEVSQPQWKRLLRKLRGRILAVLPA